LGEQRCEQQRGVARRAPVNLMEPLFDVVERLRVGHVVDDDDAVRAAVVAAGDRAEALLARRVPLHKGGTSIVYAQPALHSAAKGARRRHGACMQTGARLAAEATQWRVQNHRASTGRWGASSD
jgi:hypothetical protein